MSKKIKPLSKINPFRINKHSRFIDTKRHNTAGDFNTIQRQLRLEREICFICLERHGLLASNGRYVCTRCRREHGYS